MFSRFRRLLGDPGPQPATPSLDRAQASTRSPFPDGEVSEGGRENAQVSQFICREAILDRRECIVGYEFSLAAKMRSRIQDVRELVQKVYDDVLLRNLSGLNVDSLLGSRLAFVRLSPASLDNPLILSLPRQKTVLMISPTQQGFDAAKAESDLAKLSAAGFRHGWVLRRGQLESSPDLLRLAAVADFAEIKTGSFDGIEISSLTRQLRLGRAPVSGRPGDPIRLIARELASYDEFHLCFKAGFEYFHGPFVISRENWKPPESDLDRFRLFEILRLVRSDADNAQIAEQLKREPVLSFKLLRFLGSAAAGLRRPIDSIPQALTFLGRDSLFRWLSLLFFDLSSPGYRERMLTEQALVRGRFLENLAGTGLIPADREMLFLLGTFSQLDLLLGRPLAEVLDQARLPEPVSSALLGVPGPWLDALQLAVAAQEMDSDAIAAAAARCQVDGRQVAHGSLDALAWVSTLNGPAGERRP